MRKGLVALALIAVIASAWLAVVSRESDRPMPRGERPPANGQAVDAESAKERLVRLLGGVQPRWSTMDAPVVRRPDVQQLPLRSTRHDGHAGLFDDRPDGYRPAAIVVHATGSGRPNSEFTSLRALGDFFQRNGVAASHYGVDRAGRIAQFVPDSEAAFHVSVPGWNGISIGIELLNDNSGQQSFPPAQLAALRRLVLHLGDVYGIPVEGVVPHREIQPEDRRDPALNFDWASFRDSLSAQGDRVGRSRSRLGSKRLDVD